MLGFEKFQKLVDMAFDLHLGKDLEDSMVRPDDEGGAFDSHVLAAVQRLQFPYPVGLTEFALCVGEQGEWELMLVFELLMGGDRVLAHPKYGHAQLFQAGERVPKVAGFLRAARRKILGIE